MSVVISGISSSSMPVRSGVPQGSVVGPLLFIIFVNYLIHDLGFFANLFADDLKLFAPIGRDLPSYTNGISALQADIDVLDSRAKSWGLEFASHKCVRLRFARPFSNLPPPCLYSSMALKLPWRSLPVTWVSLLTRVLSSITTFP